MNEEQFRELVAKMRDSQDRYFKRRDPADLRAAKSYEKIVDAELRRVAAPKLKFDKGE